jgi:broad specificity phosphatase PhoE
MAEVWHRAARRQRHQGSGLVPAGDQQFGMDCPVAGTTPTTGERKEVDVSGRLLGLERGPESITLVRHGESVGNLADSKARTEKAERLDLDARDADVPLSDTGASQAVAVRDHLATLRAPDRPTLVVSSPYERAAATARVALEGIQLDLVLDERLRERDLGQFDGLTGAGIRRLYAEEARRRTKVGKFYYQPPGGESWADVVLRVRSLLADLRHGFEGERVWMFTHQAVIMAFRYVLEGIAEADLLDIDRTSPIPNCSLTRYELTPEGPRLVDFAATTVLDRQDADVTDEPAKHQRTAAS